MSQNNGSKNSVTVSIKSHQDELVQAFIAAVSIQIAKNILERRQLTVQLPATTEQMSKTASPVV